MYQRPAGFVTDQQIWMLGVLMKYMLNKVMHMSHNDFMTAFKIDLGPLLGECGLWVLKNYEQRMGDKGKTDKKKKARNAIDLISEFLENAWENLGKIAKYNLKNRYGPKKLPNEAVARADVKNIYSWNHYAPLAWFQHTRKNVEGLNPMPAGKGSEFNVCSHCGSPESHTVKHKRCSACRHRLYCSVDCQRMDWKAGHKNECKRLAAELAKATRV